MSHDSTTKSSNSKVREHRERLRSQGLRPVQVWVPDVRSASFLDEARRQSAAVATSGFAEEDRAFIDAVTIGADGEAG